MALAWSFFLSMPAIYLAAATGSEEYKAILYLTKDIVPFSSESIKIHVALRGYDEVQGLFNLSLIGTLQEEFDQVQVIGMLPTTELQQSVDTCFQKYSVIDGIQTYTWLLIPTDLPPSV